MSSDLQEIKLEKVYVCTIQAHRSTLRVYGQLRSLACGGLVMESYVDLFFSASNIDWILDIDIECTQYILPQ